MSLRRTAEPAVEPVSLAEAKLHLAVDASDTDALITLLIKAARRQSEHRAQRSWIDQEWTLSLDSFPDDIRLHMGRVTAITSVSYVDGDGVTQALDGLDYYLDNCGEYAQYIVPAYGTSWPATRDQANAVTVVYRAGGADAAAVPEDVKQWILLLVGQWFRTREAGVEKMTAEVPRGFWDALLDPYSVVSV